MMVELFFLKVLNPYDGFPKVIKAYGLPLERHPNLTMPRFVIEMTYVGHPITYTGHMVGCSEGEPRRILGEICQLLQILHTNNIVHCDLKSHNVLMDGTKISLIDFGHSHMLNPTTRRLGHSRQVEQTPTGMAPESLPDSILPRTEKIDIWSLGCLYYWLLFNEYMFTDFEDIRVSTSTGSYLSQISRQQCDPLDRELLHMMLVVDPTHRTSAVRILDKLNITTKPVPQLWTEPDKMILTELSIELLPLWYQMEQSTQKVGSYMIQYLEKKMIGTIRPIRYTFHQLVYLLVLKLFEPRAMYDENHFSGCRLEGYDDPPDVIFNLYISFLDDILRCFPRTL